MRRPAWTISTLAVLVLGAWWAVRGSDPGSTAPLLTPEVRIDAGSEPSDVELVAPAAGPVAHGRLGAVEPAPAARAPEPEPAPALAPAPALDGRPIAATLEGRVLGEDAHALSARVELVHPTTGETRTAETMDGYRFDDVEPGAWWVRVRSEQRAWACERIELEPGPNRKDFVLSPMRSIAVHLETRSGEPMVRALEAGGHGAWRPHVFATLEPPGAESLDGKARTPVGWFEEGRRHSGAGSSRALHDPPWDVTGWPDLAGSPSWIGTLHLSVDSPVYVAVANLPNVLDAVRAEPGTSSVTLRVDVEDLRPAYASLSVRLTAADTGEPVAKSWFVRLVSWTTQYPGMPAADEGYRFERVPAGRYELHVAVPGFVGTKRAVELAPGEDMDAGTIELERIEPAAGTVLDPLGRGAAVKVESGPYGARVGYQIVQSSGEDGRFTLAMGYEDGLELRVRPTALEGIDGAVASRIVRVDAGLTGDVVVRLERCSRLVLRPDGAGAAGTRYDVVDEEGGRYARGVLRDAGPISIELPVGWYEVVLVDSASVERRRAVQLGERPVVLDIAGP